MPAPNAAGTPRPSEWWRPRSPAPTPGALARLTEAGLSPAALIARHRSGDWGDVDADDRRANDRAVRDGHRVLSAYGTNAGRVWLITEWDRTATTLLLPEEY